MLGLLIADLGLGGVLGSWGWIGVYPFVTGALRWCPLKACVEILRRHASRRTQPGDLAEGSSHEDGHPAEG
jgi:hypothetical protein